MRKKSYHLGSVQTTHRMIGSVLVSARISAVSLGRPQQFHDLGELCLELVHRHSALLVEVLEDERRNVTRHDLDVGDPGGDDVVTHVAKDGGALADGGSS